MAGKTIQAGFQQGRANGCDLAELSANTPDTGLQQCWRIWHSAQDALQQSTSQLRWHVVELVLQGGASEQAPKRGMRSVFEALQNNFQIPEVLQDTLAQLANCRDMPESDTDAGGIGRQAENKEFLRVIVG